MEEKKKNKRFPVWIGIFKIAIVAGLIFFSMYSLSNGALNIMGLLVSMMAVWIVNELYRAYEENAIEAYYEYDIDELKSQINALDQENAELRDALKKANRVEKTVNVEKVEEVKKPSRRSKNRKSRKNDD